MPELDTYPAVQDEEEEKKRTLYPGAVGPMPTPTPAPVPAAVPPPEMPQAQYPAPSIGGPGPGGATQPAPPPPPAWKDYAPPERHGWAKVGSALAGYSAPINEIVNKQPEQRAQQRYNTATSEYKEQLGAGEATRKETSEAELKGAQATHATAQAGALNRGADSTVVTDSKGVQHTIPMKDLEKFLQEQEKQTGANLRQEEKDVTAADIASGKAPPTKTVMQNGKPHVVAWNPDTSKYDRDQGEAPPPGQGSAYAATRTVNLIDPETGLPTVYQYDATTGGYTKQVGTSATGAYGHEMAQAGAVERAGTDIIKQLHDPTNREILGQISSYIKQGTLGTPLADARAANLSSQLKTFAALQPAMHGFRARSAQEAFEKIIGGLTQDPDATIASIEGILKTAHAINPAKEGGGGPAAIELERGPDGKLRPKAAKP